MKADTIIRQRVFRKLGQRGPLTEAEISEAIKKDAEQRAAKQRGQQESLREHTKARKLRILKETIQRAKKAEVARKYTRKERLHVDNTREPPKLTYASYVEKQRQAKLEQIHADSRLKHIMLNREEQLSDER